MALLTARISRAASQTPGTLKRTQAQSSSGCMLHGAILVVGCNGEQAQRLRKENWNGFPFRAHSSQVARSNPFLVVFIH